MTKSKLIKSTAHVCLLGSGLNWYIVEVWPLLRKQSYACTLTHFKVIRYILGFTCLCLFF